MKKGKKIVIGIAAAAVVIGGLYAVFGQKKEVVDEDTRPAITVQKPEKGNITIYTDVIGTIEPSETVSVMPKMGGEILEVYFEAGQYIEAGQPLCRIDSDALTALRIQMETAQVTMNEAASNLQRMQALYEAGTISQQSFEQTQNGATSARLQYEAAKNKYDLQSEYTVVTAPISGVIESRNIETHDQASTDKKVCVISAKDQIMVKFSVPERVMKKLETGLEITLDKYGTEYKAVITEIASAVDQSSGLYQIKANVENGEALTTGSRVKITVLKDKAENVLTVPVDAVSYDDGKPFVYIYENGTAKQVYIEAGIYDMDIMEIKGGITADDQLINSWSNELTDGVEVKLVDENQAETEDAGTETAESSAE